ncbi:MAG: AAA family ATPase [Deltaproteobacteria bacterium]|nr:AAA family ATPase [Deltaproteobacteria bacterium]
MKGRVIAVAGKGGTGKTTIGALLIRSALKSKVEPILAVDADPNYCLGEAMGMDVGETVGLLREDFGKLGSDLPPGMSKANYLEMQANKAVVEGDGVDLVTMGRQEGPGCYCFANDVLRSVVDNLQDNYPLVVVDNEAGLEHLSRRTTRHVDWMVMVSDPAPKGLRAIERVLGLIGELKLDVRKKSLVINRVPEKGLDPALLERAEKMRLDAPPLLVPADHEIEKKDIAGESLLDIENCQSCGLVDELFSQIMERT